MGLGKEITEVKHLSHIREYTVSARLITGDIYLCHLWKVVVARFLHLCCFPFPSSALGVSSIAVVTVELFVCWVLCCLEQKLTEARLCLSW